MNELITIHEDRNFPVDGRELHESLKVESNYTTWFDRMCAYGFEENRDYEICFPNLESDQRGGQNKVVHYTTLSMAKEICCVQRTEIGQQVRRYLLDVENAWNSPDMLMARALRMADKTISSLKSQVLHLQAVNSHLTVQNQVMAPKAEYFDELVDRGVNLNFRETAKEIGVKEREFVAFLLAHKYIYRDKKGKLQPFAQYVNDLFVVKECYNEKTDWGGSQTLITPKGRETFRLLMQGWKARPPLLVASQTGMRLSL